MKFVLLAIVVVALVWMLRGGLRRAHPPRRPSSSATPQAMLSCAQCGIHLPRDEALPGRGGVFCGAEHREAFEQAHPDT